MKEQFTEVWARLREPTKDAEAPEDISSGYCSHLGLKGQRERMVPLGMVPVEMSWEGGGGTGGTALITEERSHRQNRGCKSGRDR